MICTCRDRTSEGPLYFVEPKLGIPTIVVHLKCPLSFSRQLTRFSPSKYVVVLSKVKALCTVVYNLETEDNSSPLTMVAYG